VLGYPNAYGCLPATPRYRELDLGRNGSYVVFRKLGQDVAALWSWLRQRAAELSPDAVDATTDALAAKLMGRWRSGASLAQTPEHDDPRLATPERVNDFGYLEQDPIGLRCPVGSHVRRANPRDARGGRAEESAAVVGRHRILRRGRAFGPPLADADARAGRHDGCARGLYFISLQASIARGFEFVQQTWLTNPGFGGLFGEPDPIAGNSDGTAAFTIPARPLPLRLCHVPRVVTVHGGGYFLLPSLTALGHLARPPW
jgi:Dyp-type peroxidase family